MGRAEAVRPGVPAPDDHHVLPLGRDGRRGESALSHQVGGFEVVHGRVDAGQVPAGHGEVARLGGAPGQQHAVEFLEEGPGGHHRGARGECGPGLGSARAHAHRATELDPLRPELVEPAVEHPLLHLELGDAVAEEPARALGPLEHHHRVPGPDQLLGGRQPGGPRAHHRHPLAGGGSGRDGADPPLGPGPLDDLVLDPLDGHRIVVDAEDTRSLTGCRAQPAGELGEVVGGVQPFDGRRPVVPVDEVVPLGDEVAEGAAVVAERDPAVHAARPLVPGRLGREGLVHLAPVAQAHRDGTADGKVPPVLEEPGHVTHGPPP